MRTPTQITVLTTTAALTLGVGIPVLAVTLKPAGEVVRGTVVSPVPGMHAVLIHPVGGGREIHGRTVLVRVRKGQLVRTRSGSEDVDLLLPGQHVQAHLRPGSHQAQDITATT